MPGSELGHDWRDRRAGGRRWRSSHSAPRSTIRRASRNRSSWVSSLTCVGSASIWSHVAGKLKMSRAATHARITSTTPAPVSSVMRLSNEMPDRLTIWLATCVAMISRRSRWSRISGGTAAAARSGSSRTRSGSRYGSSGSSVRTISVMLTFFVYASSDGELRRRQTDSGGLAFGDLLVGRQELQCPVEPAFGLEHVQVAGVHVDHRQRLPAGDRQGQRLRPVVVEHQLGDLVGHLAAAARCARSAVMLAVRHHGAEQDLDVDLVVAAVDAGRVVDRVGVDQTALEGELDRGRAG